MPQVQESFEKVRQFKGSSLRDTISMLEYDLRGKPGSSCQSYFGEKGINSELLLSALLLKRAASEIDVVVHALGILLSLPYILQPSERVEYLSLGAGNTGRQFDLETDLRIAEFKFINWKGGPEAIRQNQVFKDFFLLAEHETTKGRFLYVTDKSHPLRFLRGRRALKSVLSRNAPLLASFESRYGSRFKVVSDYYDFRRTSVELCDLFELVPWMADVPELEEGTYSNGDLSEQQK